jgi:hypothetical protein
MNLGDVKTRVKRQFGDDAGIQITDADITRWVNDAQREIAENNDDVLQVTATANVVTGVNTYNLPTDYRLIRGLKYNGNHLRGMTLQDFDNYIDGLDSLTTQNYSQGIPIVYNVWAGQFKVFPTPSTTAALTSGFTIYYLRNPVDVVNDSDSLEYSNSYHNHIVEYCLRMAYELDENWQGAQQVGGRFQQGINRLKERDNWSNREKYPTITINPEDQAMYFPGWF